MPAPILSALCFIAPLCYFAALWLPALTLDKGPRKYLLQFVGAIVSVGLWVGIHNWALELHPEWDFSITMGNFLLGIFGLIALALLGAEKSDF